MVRLFTKNPLRADQPPCLCEDTARQQLTTRVRGSPDVPKTVWIKFYGVFISQRVYSVLLEQPK